MNYRESARLRKQAEITNLRSRLAEFENNLKTAPEHDKSIIKIAILAIKKELSRIGAELRSEDYVV